MSRRERFTSRDARDLYLEFARFGRPVLVSRLTAAVADRHDRRAVEAVYRDLAKSGRGRVVWDYDRGRPVITFHY